MWADSMVGIKRAPKFGKLPHVEHALAEVLEKQGDINNEYDGCSVSKCQANHSSLFSAGTTLLIV